MSKWRCHWTDDACPPRHVGHKHPHLTASASWDEAAACSSANCCTCGISVRSSASQKWKSPDTLMPPPTDAAASGREVEMVLAPMPPS